MKYLIVIEQTETGYSAYAPDLPGCVAAGESSEKAEENMRSAIQFHIDGLKLEGMEIPEPAYRYTYVEVAA